MTAVILNIDLRHIQVGLVGVLLDFSYSNLELLDKKYGAKVANWRLTTNKWNSCESVVVFVGPL